MYSQWNPPLRLSLVINVMENPISSTSQSLLPSFCFSDSTITEFRKRMTEDKNAASFNALDRLPLEMAKSRILNACSVAHHKCPCVGLREKWQNHDAPYLISFRTNLRLKSLSAVAKSLPKSYQL